ncbi:hypothetical protein LTR20_002346 [Exophiala xenobiotica]|nr:hypothetical protein LTS13_009578 [Exophiala xenobiotica]KAK5400629.1 hypothetical protein LTR79_002731 [Exophiala xenobiotica]KAK5420934.1 hypothetical protein LTR90_003828 [Exophiala xenobiotica]KAK5469835.1 hypothetical protein LTR20_002346 [Exophiala xenobiotica]KAK5499066.1 hypothetical protein LTR83_004375 [Exophiala xenobiotica]
MATFPSSSPCVSACSCTEPLPVHTTPTISHDNKTVETCAQCNGIIVIPMPMPERTPPIFSSFRFFDLPPEVRDVVLAYFADVPPYPFLRVDKPHDIDVVNVDRGTTSKQPCHFGAQPDESLIRHFSIWEREHHPCKLPKEWQEYRDVTTTRKSLLSVSKAVRSEWAPTFYRTTTIHVGDTCPVRPEIYGIDPAPRRFEEAFLSKIEQPLLSCVRRLVYYPAWDRKLSVLGYYNSQQYSKFCGTRRLEAIVSRYPALSNLEKLSVFVRPQLYEPLPVNITSIFNRAQTRAYRHEWHWGMLDWKGVWQGFASSMARGTGLRNGLGVEREMGIDNSAGLSWRFPNGVIIWWRLEIERKSRDESPKAEKRGEESR